MPLKSYVRQFFESNGQHPIELEVKNFPQEVHVLGYFSTAEFEDALLTSARFPTNAPNDDRELFVIARKATASMVASAGEVLGAVKGLDDSRLGELLNLVSARSRVSGSQPSLSYVKDARANLSAVTAARHHLIFGRRGAGKTALLVEARRRLDADGQFTAWVNIQALRREPASRIVLYTIKAMLEAALISQAVADNSRVSTTVSALVTRVDDQLVRSTSEAEAVHRLVPQVQLALRDYLSVAGKSLYVFLDDFYYLPRHEQAETLDMIHSCTRDANVWLKIATIKHLTRWWQASPPVGLQSGQDADIIDLDITLQDPKEAQAFLEGVLLGFASRVGIARLSQVFRKAALDRLVIASGAVPRDYLVLASGAISRAQRRSNARLVGVQDVNQAAGDAATAKIQELEDDLAATEGIAAQTLETLKRVRAFCLEEAAFTYFLVAHRDREDEPDHWAKLTDLMDVRLLHLVYAGVSDPHTAGHRYDAFMLDLSQYSGSRLKQKLKVLDFSDGRFVAKETTSSTPDRVAQTPLGLIAILRTAPTLSLATLG